MKESDSRYVPPEFWAEAKRLTGVNWRRASDVTPRNHKTDSLKRKWRAKRVYMNPPFSQSQKFVSYALDQLTKGNIQELLILLPWYQVQRRKGWTIQPPQWWRKAQRRMRPYLQSRHKMYVRFLKPDLVQYKTPLTVFIFHLKKEPGAR